jgi:hypothetical protein
MTHARAIEGYPSPGVDDVISILLLVGYISAILALSAGVTWAVVRISPSESTKQAKREKEQRRREREAA